MKGNVILMDFVNRLLSAEVCMRTALSKSGQNSILFKSLFLSDVLKCSKCVVMAYCLAFF